MINVSQEYKKIMSRPIRNRAYISVGIGIIDQDAQASGSAKGNFAWWTKGDIFNTNISNVEYGTLEEGFMKADGKMLFLPEQDELVQIDNNGITTENIFESIRIEFPQVYDIKGLTVNFGSAYPTRFQVQTQSKSLTYENQSELFITMDNLGDTDYIIITPEEMVGGKQRFRIKSILMGVGLSYQNEQTKNFSHKDFCSTISDELPKETTTFAFFDEEKRFNVDDENSFIDYLETMQKVTVSFGLELDDGAVEWHQIATNYLKDWKSQNGVVTLTATDRLSQMKDKYELGFKIYTRTAYEEAESILKDAGLAEDEYYIDEYLKDVILNNPMPKQSHKNCLQLLANACRCILRQNETGQIIIKANFANVINADDMQVITNGHTQWSNPDNVIIGNMAVYGELTKDFMKADGTMYFLPENANYLETAYVSEQVADNEGDFLENPTISIQLPAAYVYYGVQINFDGNPPQDLIIHTYKYGEAVDSVQFSDLQKENSFIYRFSAFDKMVFEFTKGYPQNRVLVNSISFGELTDYTLQELDWMKFPVGYKENRTKSVLVKIFSYQNDEKGIPKEVEDEVYVQKAIGEVGVIKTLENPLISTEEHALELAEWIGNYYANNIYYTVNYRGEPRVMASDIIRAYSKVKNNMQMEVTQNDISFNGKFSGNMEYRRALKMM